MKDFIIVVQIGKRKWLQWDLLDEVHKGTTLSKSEIRRLFKAGAVTIYAPEGVKWSD